MFKNFDSLDAAFDWMTTQTMAANENAMPIQKSIGRGCYAIRPAPEIGGFIFGYIFSEDEVHDMEIQCGADEAEVRSTMATLQNGFERGYRFGRWHSVVVPEGELGDAHIINLMPIREEDFELAKVSEWEVEFAVASLMIRESLRTWEANK